MRTAAAVILLCALSIGADEPKLIVKPGAFPTLVNPNCSHCIDESKRRKEELKDDDRVLIWTRGKYDGGAIPYRFFLNPYPVISDTYGVFVHDRDAGYARGFKASVDFTFHGWRNGVMVMKHKDGTLYSCLSGIAFDGPRKGDRLESWPTIVSDWGWVMKHYPNIVAYQMFDKYKPVETPTKPNEDSLKSRGKADPRLPADEMVVAFEPRGRANPRAYPLSFLKTKIGVGVINDSLECGNKVVVLFQESTQTAAAYRPFAEKRKETKQLSVQGEAIESKEVALEIRDRNEVAPFVDTKTGSRFDIAGRCQEGELKGWTLATWDSVAVKWFAWAAEFPHTRIYGEKNQDPFEEKPKPDPKPETKQDPKAKANDAIREVAGAAEFLRSIPKKFASFQGLDAKTGKVKLLIEGEKEAKEWSVEPDVEIKTFGWWGRINQFDKGDRVWVWFKTDRKKQPASILMMADEVSEQYIHGNGMVVKEANGVRIVFTPDRGGMRTYSVGKIELNGRKPPAPKIGERLFVQSANGEAKLILDADSFEFSQLGQQLRLRELWEKQGLPATVSFVHLSGEADLMLDHETMRWARSLKTGDKVKIAVDPPINGVVKHVNAWRERTQVRVVINGQDLPGIKIGQRIHMQMTPPSDDVINADYPPDIDKPKTKEDRIDWFLANTYCCCKVGGDGCTGHFYTLASCNPNACAAPNATRKKIADKIDEGLSNNQIWTDLKAERGNNMIKPHLAP
jgi:Protein of unknown function (DUF3179)